MTAASVRRARPATPEEAAETLAATASEGGTVRFLGGRTKERWGRSLPSADLELDTTGLDQVVEHNAGDLTAVVQAGVRVADLQERIAGDGQMLALDPPDTGATVGGLIATGDSGPLRHRHGAPRDLVLGVTVALSDGTLARAGGKVIKNVAGYDLAKLMSGSFGTLGLIVEVALRLHPRPARTATAVLRGGDPAALAAAAADLAHRPLEHLCLDLVWSGGEGAVLARYAGSTAADQARAALAVLGGGEVVEDDEALWQAQRDGQRSDRGTVLRASALPADLGRVVAIAQRHGARVVARAAHGLAWIALDGEDPQAVESLHADLAPATAALLDAPDPVRAAVEPWPDPPGPTLDLMRRVKARFDPAGACNPGIFVGGI